MALGAQRGGLKACCVRHVPCVPVTDRRRARLGGAAASDSAHGARCCSVSRRSTRDLCRRLGGVARGRAARGLLAGAAHHARRPDAVATRRVAERLRRAGTRAARRAPRSGAPSCMLWPPGMPLPVTFARALAPDREHVVEPVHRAVGGPEHVQRAADPACRDPPRRARGRSTRRRDSPRTSRARPRACRSCADTRLAPARAAGRPAHRAARAACSPASATAADS